MRELRVVLRPCGAKLPFFFVHGGCGRWRAEEEARRASIAESHERYHSRGGEGASVETPRAAEEARHDAASDRHAQGRDPRAVRPRLSRASGAKAQTSRPVRGSAKETKVRSTVCTARTGLRVLRRGTEGGASLFGGGGGGGQDGLVSVLGLLKVRES